MRKTTFLLYAIIFSTLLGATQCTSNSDKQLHQVLTRMAANLNLSTPAVLDVHTRFDSAFVTQENIFQYHYTIAYTSNPSDLLRNQKEELINNMKEAFTNDESLQIFKENEVTIQYVYKDTAQNIIDIITIDPETYK